MIAFLGAYRILIGKLIIIKNVCTSQVGVRLAELLLSTTRAKSDQKTRYTSFEFCGPLMLMIICTPPNYVILNRLHLKLAHNCVCMSSCVSIGSDFTYQPHKTTSLVNFDESIWRPSEIRPWMDPTKVLTKDALPDGWSAYKHRSRSA